jgi:CheY-like chemotaxis protein
MSTLRRILFIDDQEGQRELYTRLYQMVAKSFHGECEFLTAGTWEEGLNIMRMMIIDVLLLDLVVPPFTLKTMLAEVAVTKDLPPVVGITGHEEDGVCEMCFAAGMDGFMKKSEVRHHPEELCRMAYHCYLRRNRPELKP